MDEAMRNGGLFFLAQPEAATKYPGWVRGRALSAFSAQPQIKHNHAFDTSRRLFETSSQNAKKSQIKNLFVARRHPTSEERIRISGSVNLYSRHADGPDHFNTTATGEKLR